MRRCCTGVEPWCLGKCVVKLVVWAVLQQSNVHLGVVEGFDHVSSQIWPIEGGRCSLEHGGCTSVASMEMLKHILLQ